jgi:hypothetical protein
LCLGAHGDLESPVFQLEAVKTQDLFNMLGLVDINENFRALFDWRAHCQLPFFHKMNIRGAEMHVNRSEQLKYLLWRMKGGYSRRHCECGEKRKAPCGLCLFSSEQLTSCLYHGGRPLIFTIEHGSGSVLATAGRAETIDGEFCAYVDVCFFNSGRFHGRLDTFLFISAGEMQMVRNAGCAIAMIFRA